MPEFTVNEKAKRGIEISRWKVEGTDAFAAISPEWTDEELDRGLNNNECYDAEVTRGSKPDPEENHKR